MIKEKEKIKLSKDIDFVKIAEDQKPELDNEIEEDSDFVFFCKDCKDIVDVDFKIFRWKKEYFCKICWSYKIVSWIRWSLKKHFRVK